MMYISKKKILTIVLGILLVISVFSQSTENDNQTDVVDRVPTDTGRQILREMLVTSFEDPTLWRVDIAEDLGNITTRRMFGSPLNKADLAIEDQSVKDKIQQVDITDEYVLGIKTQFYRRSQTAIDIMLRKSMFIPGIVKKMSLWVLGRNKRHQLSVIILDMEGKTRKIPIDTLDFVGWKKLEVVIPESVAQQDFNAGNFYGVYLKGFHIDTYFEDTVGSFYTYFDDLRIVRDAMVDFLFSGEDEISDGW